MITQGQMGKMRRVSFEEVEPCDVLVDYRCPDCTELRALETALALFMRKPWNRPPPRYAFGQFGNEFRIVLSC